MAYIYSDPTRETDPHALPDVEVFYLRDGEGSTPEAEPLPAGWYWWPCFPGCLPDSDPEGPYTNEEEAIAAAREFADF